jgi:hypothetical protein
MSRLGGLDVAPSARWMSHLRRRWCRAFGALDVAPSARWMSHLRRAGCRTFGGAGAAPSARWMSHLRRAGLSRSCGGAFGALSVTFMPRRWRVPSLDNSWN